ncbi:enoyl-CoA hydratase/carnithine racemase [Tamaricihabitans halophyticus]|uniref:Enoyl-CoA hydratase/carnithine racemase n=1 Tax=Tamaricihabitans halophyticus TaxID=1262583 RepID=A0A4R2QFC7_9PSEU|nr:enoyl-CoA hydratase/isomerase family protein [Tamaricihabitans halophyticus]TCP47830.1 enoyl-CoA hydratase/carnithine racemase [Tamaricihabitans halophyticus]
MADEQEQDAVLVSSNNGITTISINRPKQLNTINDAVIEGLHNAWHTFNASDDRCAILTGVGAKAFCAGADLGSFRGEMWESIPNVGVRVDKPVIAAVNGYCVGGGCVLMLYCDLAIAGESAQFWYPEAQVGFTGGVVTGIASRMPLKFAMEFALLGERIGPEQARQMGMLNRVTADDEVLASAERMARTLCDSAPLVVKALKGLMLDTVSRSPLEVAGVARGQLAEVLHSADRQEGIAAFREKRAPKFQGK